MPFPNRQRVGIDFSDSPSMTKQGEAPQTDINYLVSRGVPPVRVEDMQYLDVVALPDYLEAHQLVAKMQSEFAALPSMIRDRYKNNPANLIESFQAFADGQLKPSDAQWMHENGLIDSEAFDNYQSLLNPNPSPAEPKKASGELNDDDSNDDE